MKIHGCLIVQSTTTAADLCCDRMYKCFEWFIRYCVVMFGARDVLCCVVLCGVVLFCFVLVAVVIVVVTV